MANRVYANTARVIPATFLAGQIESELITCRTAVASEYAKNAAGYMQAQAIETQLGWDACDLEFDVYRSDIDVSAKPIILCDGSDSSPLIVPTIANFGSYILLPYWFYSVVYFKIRRSVAVSEQTVNIIMQPINQVPA